MKPASVGTLEYTPHTERLIVTFRGDLRSHRIVPSTDLHLRASRVYVANEQRDGCFQLTDQVWCVIEKQEASFWEIDQDIK